MQTTYETDRSEDVKKLNSFLRGEISAVETYRQAIEKFEGSSEYSPILSDLYDCMRSHERRVQLLQSEIRRLGGQPSEGSGVWGAFAKLVEGGSKLFGKKAAIAALEEGEDHGRDDYLRDLDALGPDARRFVEIQLLPEQLRTHDALSRMQ